jgi:hypothetical protein
MFSGSLLRTHPVFERATIDKLSDQVLLALEFTGGVNRKNGFVNLGSQLTDSSHEERPIPLPRTPFPAGNHRLCRMGLSSLLSELP